MKKLQKLFFLFLFIAAYSFKSYGQYAGLPRMAALTPNVESVAIYGDVPVNYYTGVPSINIPLYEINSGDIKINLSLSYHSGGIRVDQEASLAGLGWALLSGGLVTTTKTLAINPLDLPCTQTTNSQPYRFNFLNYSGDFIIDLASGKAVAITQSDLSIIVLPSEAGFEIRTPNGNRFLFTQKETSSNGGYNTTWYLKSISSSGGTFISFDYTQAATPDFRTLDLPSAQGVTNSQSNVNSIQVNGITVNSSYFSNSQVQVNGCPYIYGPDGSEISIVSGETPVDMKTTYLEKINFENGEVGFEYEDRTDLNHPGILLPKRLKSITVNVVRSGVPQLLKKFLMTYNYSDYNGMATVSSKRLLLKEVTEQGSDLSTGKNWAFTYNTTVNLPLKTSKDKDHWGFYNGPVNNTEMNPELGANREPSITYTTAGLLKSIKYPTGGTVQFEFEANDYSNKNSTGFKAGGGVRIKKIITNDGIKNLVKRYEYKKKSGNNDVSSGKLIHDLNYGINKGLYNIPAQCNGTRTYTNPSTGQTIHESLNIIISYSMVYRHLFAYPRQPFMVGYGPSVGYDKVTVYTSEYNTEGKTDYEFINDEAPGLGIPGYFLNRARTDNGMLTKKTDYSYDANLQTYSPAYSEENQYEKVNSKEFNFYEQHTSQTGHYYNPYQVNCNHSQFYLKYFESDWVRLKKRIKKTYAANVPGTPLITSTDYSYKYNSNPKLFIPSQELTTDSRNETIVSNFKYPDDFSTVSPYDEMINRHIINPVIEQTISNVTTGKELAKTVSNYQFWQSNALIMPVTYQQSIIGHTLETQQTVNRYDSKGHILESTGRNGMITSYIYGYNLEYPVAKIVNKSYTDAVNQSGLVLSVLNNNSTSDPAMRAELNKLRSLSNCFVTTYTYALLTGVTSETDPNGKTIYYEYDHLNRLTLIRDQDNNILKRICYGYSGEPENCSTAQLQYSAGITRLMFKNNCTGGLIPKPVWVIVPYGQFVSYDLADANAQAEAYAQQDANTRGTCIPPIYGRLEIDVVESTFGENEYEQSSNFYVSLKVKFYADPAYTTPLILTSNMPVTVKEHNVIDFPNGNFSAGNTDISGIALAGTSEIELNPMTSHFGHWLVYDENHNITYFEYWKSYFSIDLAGVDFGGGALIYQSSIPWPSWY